MLSTHWLPVVACLLSDAVTLSAALPPSAKHYSLDGHGNNQAHMDWGARGTAEVHRYGVCYADGLASPRFVLDPANPNSTRANYQACLAACRDAQAAFLQGGGSWSYKGLPPVYVGAGALSCDYACNDLLGASARAISNRIFTNLRRRQAMNPKRVNDLHTYFGHMVGHDMHRSLGGGDDWPIRVPECDAWWDPECSGTASMPFARNGAAVGTGTGGVPRRPVNLLSSWMDANFLYGGDFDDDKSRFNLIRNGNASDAAFHSCHLKLVDNPEPPAGNGWPKFYDIPEDSLGYLQVATGSAPGFPVFVTGEARGNADPGTLGLITLFARLHNRLCDELVVRQAGATDEELFWQARKWVIAYVQDIFYYEYVPALLGQPLPPYEGYAADADPAFDPYHTVAAFRYGHSEVNEMFLRLDEAWEAHEAGPIAFRDAVFNPGRFLDAGLDPVLRGLIAQPQGKVDAYIIDSMVNNVFAGPQQRPDTVTWSGHCLALAGSQSTTAHGAYDLQATNIQRGREQGLCGINTVRARMGLPRYKSWHELVLGTNWSAVPTDDPGHALAQDLLEMYGPDPDNGDFIVAGLAENHGRGESSLGAAFAKVVSDNWARVRRADRFYFENRGNGLFTADEVTRIFKTSLSDIIKYTTNIIDVPNRAFMVPDASLRHNGAGSVKELPVFEEYQHSVFLSPNFKFAWSSVQRNGTVCLEMAIAAPTLGWVGVGFAAAGVHVMQESDMVIGRLVHGVPTVDDMYSSIIGTPVRDVDRPDGRGRDDLLDTSIVQLNGVTTVYFTRPVTTGDIWDVSLRATEGKVRVAFAFQPSGNAELEYHGAARGYTQVQLFEPTCVEGNYLNDMNLDCVPCPRGMYRAADMGKTKCEECPIGTFQPQAGASSCIPCEMGSAPAGSTTLMLGAVSAESCGCPVGTRAQATANGSKAECIECEEGLSCPAGTVEPMQAADYYVEVLSRQPLVTSVWKCPWPGACPEAHMGSCAHGAEGRMCLRCAHPNEYWDVGNRACSQCHHSANIWQLSATVFLIFVFIGGLYSVSMTVGDEDMLTDPIELALSLSLLVFLGQSSSVYNNLAIPWTDPLKSILGLAEFMSLSFDTLRLECLGVSDFARYVYGAMHLSLVILVLMLLSCVLRRCFKHRNAPIRCWNAVGVLFNGFFIAIVLHGLAPFTAQNHPNGFATAHLFRGLVLGSPEHVKWAAVGIVHLLFYCVGFMSYAAFVCWQLRARARAGAARGIRAVLWHRFLFIKFKPSRYYWSVVMLVRVAVLAAPPVIIREPHSQLIVTQVVLCLSLCFQSYFWPYKKNWYNFADISSLLALLSLTSAGMFFLQTDSRLHAHQIVTPVSVFFIFNIVLFAGLAFFMAGANFKRRFMSKEQRQVHTEKRLREQTAFFAELQRVSESDLANFEAERRGVDVAEVCKAPIPQLEWQAMLTVDSDILQELDQLDEESLGAAEVDFIPPSAFPYMVGVQSCLRVLEERLRWRIQEHMDSSTSLRLEPGKSERKKPWRQASTSSLTSTAREIRRLDARTYSTVVWNRTEQEQVYMLSTRVLDFLAGVVAAFEEDRRAARLLEVYVDRMERRFLGVYQACVKDILSMQPGFVRAIGAARILQKEAEQEKEPTDLHGMIGAADFQRNIWTGLMQSAVRTQEAVQVYAKSVADVTGAHINRTSIKRLYRILEKMALDPKVLNGGQSRAWDTARMMLAYDDMDAMANGVEQLLQDHKSGRVQVLRVKERFSEPTSGGWSDILVNLRFPPERTTISKIPWELQLSHTQMMVIRKDMGGHHGYAKYRSARELLDLLASDRKEARVSKCLTSQVMRMYGSETAFTGVVPGEVGGTSEQPDTW